MTHTPGPWKIDIRRESSLTIAESGFYIATLMDKPGWGDMEANARLIAAAPELLAALARIKELSAKPPNLGDKKWKEIISPLMLETNHDETDAFFLAIYETASNALARVGGSEEVEA